MSVSAGTCSLARLLGPLRPTLWQPVGAGISSQAVGTKMRKKALRRNISGASANVYRNASLMKSLLVSKVLKEARSTRCPRVEVTSMAETVEV